MAKSKKPELIELIPIPGGSYDRYVNRKKTKKKDKMPKDPTKLIDMFNDEYGMENVSNMDEVGIGDYVFEKGVNHSINMTVGRNIPWLEDGLKLVERRVLYIMWRGSLYRGKFDKVSGVTGDMMKHVHPHGEASDTIYRLGRPRSIMLPYIKGQGNFGSMDTMRPASSRYASASLTPYAMDCFFSEIGAKHPIYDEKDNYKYSEKEPVYLISKYPNILMQWNQGIGKGAAAWLGAFNSKDLFKVAIKMLDDPECKVDIYPDTPVPIQIINKKEIKGCFDKAEFKVKMRAPYKLVADKKKDDNGRVIDKNTIVFTSLPLSVIGSTIKGEISDIKEKDKDRGANKRLPEVLNVEVDAKDNTPGGIELIVEYEKGYDPMALVEKLYKSTSLAKTVGVRYMLISDYKAHLFTPREILKSWISQRYDQKRRYYQQLAIKAAKDRSRLEAICTILESTKNTDKAIEIIRKSKSKDISIQALMKEFGFTHFQAWCVTQVRLENLPQMDILEISKARDQALADYKYYRKLLTSDNAIHDLIKKDLEEGLAKYGKDRNAILSNLKEDAVSDNGGFKYVFFDENAYYSASEPSEFKALVKKIDRAFKVVKIKNADQICIISKNGQNKILDGYSFNLSDVGINFSQMGIENVVSIIPITKNLTQVALITSSGYGKKMEVEDLLKSTKSKITTLAPGDYIAGVAPIYKDQNLDNGYMVAWTDDKMYYSKLENYPLLKRTAMGNRILKLNIGTLSNATIMPANLSHLMVYGDFGYFKTVESTNMIFAGRNKFKPIDMLGKKIYSVVPIVDGKANVSLYDNAGITPLEIEVAKMVKIKVKGSKDEMKFRTGTTISTPVKVLKKAKNDFYQIG